MANRARANLNASSSGGGAPLTMRLGAGPAEGLSRERVAPAAEDIIGAPGTERKGWGEPAEYLGVPLHDADRIEAVVSVPDERDLY